MHMKRAARCIGAPIVPPRGTLSQHRLQSISIAELVGNVCRYPTEARKETTKLDAIELLASMTQCRANDYGQHQG